MLFRPHSIVSKGLLLVALPVAFQFVTAAVILVVNDGAARAERDAQASTEVLQRTERISEIILNGHSAFRGMVLQRDRHFEVNARRQLDTLLHRVGELRPLVTEDVQQRHLEQIGIATEPYLVWVREQEARGRAEQWPELEAVFRTLVGKKLVDRITTSIEAFLEVQQELDAARIRAAASRRAAVQRWILVFTAGLVPLAVGVGWFFTTGIARRLSVVSSNARRMAERLPLADQVGGADEIADLDAVLHDTHRRLTENRERERLDAQELARRAASLSALNRSLEARTRENEIFVYSASHDLRSPLVNLQGFTQEIARGCEALQRAVSRPTVPPELREELDAVLREDITGSLGYIQAAVMRLSAIIDALLRLSRAGRLEYAREPVELTAIVDRVVRALRDSLTQKRADVHVGPLPRVVGDATAIEQVLANLLSNAANYLDPTRPGLIEVGATADSEPGTETVFVRDNGLGIPAMHQSKLFLPFQRLHESAAEGEGVGLALAWRIVDRLGGRLWAESTDRVGSTFYLSLPAETVEQVSGRIPE